MKTAPKHPFKSPDYSQLTAAQLRQLLVQKEGEWASDSAQQESILTAQLIKKIAQRDQRILLLEEMLRLARLQRFAASSEKSPQIDLFDEAELAVEIEALADQLPDDKQAKSRPKKRQRGFSDQLVRQRIELCLSEAEKAGAQRTFFTKVKEELDFVPARLTVLEYWQEKAVFVNPILGTDRLIEATRPVHPLGKCHASVQLLTYLLVSKYADGLPLYRLEGIVKRYHGDISRSNMAHWIVRLGNDTLTPLLSLIRVTQNSSHYVQADETVIQVLKETGKTAQSNSYMWVTRGGPPDKPSVLFNYDASRSGEVPKQLLEGFTGTLQCDGYSGYADVCAKNKLFRIGCWDHARRKFVEASKIADPKQGRRKGAKPTKADVALSKIRKLYRIEQRIKDLDDDEKRTARQQQSLPVLNELKIWLDANLNKVMKGSYTRKAMEYTLNQWETLTGYCEHGYLKISNILAENAIRPFVIGRKAWLFADTPQGAVASAACYSLIETARANDLEPYAYIQHVLTHIGAADTPEKWEALLPWNASLEKMPKKIRK